MIKLENFWQNSNELIDGILEIPKINERNGYFDSELLKWVSDIKNIQSLGGSNTDGWNELIVDTIFWFGSCEEFAQLFDYLDEESSDILNKINYDEEGNYIMTIYQNNFGDISNGVTFGEEISTNRIMLIEQEIVIMYIVQKNVETEKITENYDSETFDNYDEAEFRFNEILAIQDSLGGEYNVGEFSEFYKETISLETLIDGEFETILSKVVYSEGLKDKNNYKGNRANNYWAVGKYNGTELVYNMYDDGKNLNLEYSNIKESELDDWYNN